MCKVINSLSWVVIAKLIVKLAIKHPTWSAVRRSDQTAKETLPRSIPPRRCGQDGSQAAGWSHQRVAELLIGFATRCSPSCKIMATLKTRRLTPWTHNRSSLIWKLNGTVLTVPLQHCRAASTRAVGQQARPLMVGNDTFRQQRVNG